MWHVLLFSVCHLHWGKEPANIKTISKLSSEKRNHGPFLQGIGRVQKLKPMQKNPWRRKEVTDPSVSVELWRSSMQGETLPRSKICASFTFEYLQRWTEESIIIINCLKGSPWFASFSPQIVIPSATWWEGTDDTGSDGSAKKRFNPFLCEQINWGWIKSFFMGGCKCLMVRGLMIRDREDLQTRTLHVTCDFDKSARN